MDPLINSTESTPADDPSASTPESAAADSTVVLSGMSLDVFKAAKQGYLHALRERGVRLEEDLTATKNTALHVYLTSSSSRKLRQKNEDQVPKSTNIVKEILQMCPSLLLQQNESGDTTLHIAARQGRASVVTILIEAAKAHHDHSDLEQGMKEEANNRCLKKMIRTTNKVKNTALHEAVRFKYLNVVEMLTTLPEFCYSTNDLGETPLYLAAERGYFSMVSQMLHTCTFPAYQGPRGRTALHAAVILGDKEMTRQLLEKDRNSLIKATDDQGFTPLHLAASYDHHSIVQLLLQFDRSVSYVAKTDDKMTALHIAASKGAT